MGDLSRSFPSSASTHAHDRMLSTTALFGLRLDFAADIKVAENADAAAITGEVVAAGQRSNIWELHFGRAYGRSSLAQLGTVGVCQSAASHACYSKDDRVDKPIIDIHGQSMTSMGNAIIEFSIERHSKDRKPTPQRPKHRPDEMQE